MSNSPNPQHEPTMEEILASIRKIISEDQPDGAKPAPQPIPVRSAAVQNAAAQVEADVLELTEEVPEEMQAPLPPHPAPEPIENDIAFENIESEPKAKAMDQDELISDSARSAVERAFSKLDTEQPKPAAPITDGTLEAVFTRAVQDAFTPTLNEWVDSHKSEIMDHLKPLIREWMDSNLPPLIEAAVAKEIGRAAAERSRRR